MRRPGVMNTDGDGRQDKLVAPPRRSAVPPDAGLRRASRKRTRLVLFADCAVPDGSRALGVHASGDFFLLSADRRGVFSAAIAARSGVCTVPDVVAAASAGLRLIEAARDAESGAGPSSRRRVGPATARQDPGVALLPCPANSSSSAAPSLAPGDGLPGEGSANGGDGMAPRRRGVLAPPRASCNRSNAACPAPGVANHIRGGDGAAATGLEDIARTTLAPVRSKKSCHAMEGSAVEVTQGGLRSQGLAAECTFLALGILRPLQTQCPQHSLAVSANTLTWGC